MKAFNVFRPAVRRYSGHSHPQVLTDAQIFPRTAAIRPFLCTRQPDDGHFLSPMRWKEGRERASERAIFVLLVAAVCLSAPYLQKQIGTDRQLPITAGATAARRRRSLPLFHAWTEIQESRVCTYNENMQSSSI